MLVDASLPPAIPAARARLGRRVRNHVALWASLWQLSLPGGTGFSGTVETSPFTVFFHVLICGIVLVALLLCARHPARDSHHQGEYLCAVVFGAVGMCLLTGAVELLLVFIALEISSIATYVLAGYRKETRPRSRSRNQILPSRLLCHGVPALRHRTDLRRHWHHPDLRDRAR